MKAIGSRLSQCPLRLSPQRLLFGLSAFAPVLALWGCNAGGSTGELICASRHPLEAYCAADVEGQGSLDVESDYLPHVVHCENGGAPMESLKAQAVAARSFLYYKLQTAGSIGDGTGDQVYSCSSGPTDEDREAVRQTAGQILLYQDVVVCAFFVAGSHQSPPACQGVDDTHTEQYVTYNWGLSGDQIHQSTLGWVNSGNYRNRGCLSQWGSRCLADQGYSYTDILKFYYGMDITLSTATGSCITPPNPEPDAGPPPDAAAPLDAESPLDASTTPEASAPGPEAGGPEPSIEAGPTVDAHIPTCEELLGSSRH